LNPDLTPFQRRYVSYVKRCDELERKLRYFSQECDKFEIPIDSAGNVDEFLAARAAPSPDGKPQTGGPLLESLEAELDGYESQLRELNNYNEKLTTEYNEKVELQEVLEKSRRFFMTDAPRLAVSELTTGGSADHGPVADDRRDSLLESEGGPSARDMDMRFSSITGVVATEEKARFERMIFRATRGNCYVRFAPIKQPITDPESGQLVEKCVFIVFFKSTSIEVKLKKICDAFGAHRYSLPDMDDAPAVDTMLTENAQELVDSRTVLLKNQDTRFRLCQMLAKHTEKWTWIVLREKGVYHTLNMFKADVSGMLRGEGWVVAECFDEVRDTVNRAHSNMDMSMPSLVDHVPQPWPTPPTHFATNKFTYGYQEFVNTYGVPRYREANPALFTAATFPFLFGVMYGDIGHGLFLFLSGAYLIWNEKANDNARLGEMAGGLHAGRYMIFMMGFFAIYAGFIYNDCFSLPLNLFGSRWNFYGQDSGEVEEGTAAYLVNGYGNDNSVYPFGLDPAWKVSGNELLFFNSFKMKLSVVMGIIQMFAGTCLKGCNAIYFGEKLDFFFEFLPMVAFAASLFVYMIILIVMKWCINWNSRMLSATCLDPAGDGWGSSDYDGTWVECDGSGGKFGVKYFICIRVERVSHDLLLSRLLQMVPVLLGVIHALDTMILQQSVPLITVAVVTVASLPTSLLPLLTLLFSPATSTSLFTTARPTFRIFFSLLPLVRFPSFCLPSHTFSPDRLISRLNTTLTTTKSTTVAMTVSTKNTTLARLSFIKLSRLLNLFSVWFRTLPRTFVSGLFRLPIPSLLLCFGRRQCFRL
jgi:V-type H+-transporting ATPase subunit a